MNQNEAEHYARLLEQYQDVLVFIIATQDPNLSLVPVGQLAQNLGIRNPLAGGLYGFCTLAFVHSYDWIAQPEGFPQSIVDAIDYPTLAPTVIRIGNGETREIACFRHLRNCFAHGHFEFPQPGTTRIHLWDEDRGTRTFDVVCDAADLAPIALAVMRASHTHAANIANPLPPAAVPPPAAAPAPAAPAPAPAAVPPAGPAPGGPANGGSP